MEQQDELEFYKDYTWDYFLAHAQARLTTFRFYLVYCSFIFGGIGYGLGNNHSNITILFSIILLLITLVHYNIDRRHRTIIEDSQKALKKIEEKFNVQDYEDSPHEFKLFSRSDYLKNKKISYFSYKELSYSKSLNIIFFLFSCIAIVIFLSELGLYKILYPSIKLFLHI